MLPLLTMKVYVLVHGYDEVVGVFSTLEKAAAQGGRFGPWYEIDGGWAQNRGMLAIFERELDVPINA